MPQSRSQTGTPLVDESKNEIRDLSGSDRRILPKESPGPATRSPIRPAELKLDPPSSPEVQVPSHLRPLAQALAPYGSEIELASANTGVEANWLRAVIIQESGGHSSAVSSQGATGLMQLMPNTATSLGVRDSLNPAENIDGGARYLAAMKRRFGDFRLALAAYNAGPTRVDQYGTIPPYRETQNYVERVMNLKTEFDQVWPPDIKAGNGYESK